MKKCNIEEIEFDALCAEYTRMGHIQYISDQYIGIFSELDIRFRYLNRSAFIGL